MAQPAHDRGAGDEPVPPTSPQGAARPDSSPRPLLRCPGRLGHRRLLSAAGREVAFLGVGDIAPGPVSRSLARVLRDVLAGSGRLALRCYHELVYQSVRRGVPALGRAAQGSRRPPPTPPAHLAHRPHPGCRPPGQDPGLAPATAGRSRDAVFRTADTARRLAGLPDDLGWAALADDLRVVPIEGDHANLRHPPPHDLRRCRDQAATAGRSLPRSA